jgi:uncharacterized protein involved in exopolysaccharide biosynthesis
METATQERSELTLLELVRLVWQRRTFVALLAISGGVIAAVWSLFITPQFQTQVVVMPAVSDDNTSSTLQGLVGQLGGVASLVGAGMPGSQGREEAVEFLRSRYIADRFIASNNLAPILFAEKWDAAAKTWQRSKIPPTAGQVYRRFATRVLSIHEDRRTGLVTVSMTWSSPQQASAWANGLVQLTDTELRRRAIDEAKKSIAYLNSELDKTQVIELRQAMYRLLETQIRTIMLANGREQYAFRVIDPAVTPDLTDRVRPKRVAMTLTGVIVGLVIAVLWLMVAFSTGKSTTGREATA